jgi:hypothetical protein
MRGRDIHAQRYELLPVRHPDYENGSGGDWCIDRMKTKAGKLMKSQEEHPSRQQSGSGTSHNQLR